LLVLLGNCEERIRARVRQIVGAYPDMVGAGDRNKKIDSRTGVVDVFVIIATVPVATGVVYYQRGVDFAGDEKPQFTDTRLILQNEICL
jgi:hypothetical protein